MRKLILYIASSLDGYIAGPHDDLSFLDPFQVPGEDYGYGAFIQGVDALIMGRKTYDWLMQQVPEWPHADLDSYILTRTPREAEGGVQFYTGDLQQLILDLKAQPGKNIFCDGGAAVVNSLLQDHLIDEIILSVIPVLLGKGVRLFQNGRPSQKLQLLRHQVYDNGLAQWHYRCEKE